MCIGYSRSIWIYPKKYGGNTDNPSIRIYVNKIQNRITFRIKTGYFLENLTSEAMKFFESSKAKATKDKNSKNVSHWEITEVVLVYCNIVINNYQQDLRDLYKFVPTKSFGQLLDISSKNFIFKKNLWLRFFICWSMV